MLATGTASGKSLVYQIGAARAVLETPKATALFVFPTKALARDQLRALRALKLPQLRAAVYDGDTPKAERPLIRRNANVVLTNPDMLHLSLTADHARWGDFLLRLAVVVIDEAHVLRGVFGSQVAMVLRRLRRLIAAHGGDPRWCLASATIGNPAELAERLTGVPFTVIEADDAPRGRKLFALWNPPIIDDETGVRRSALAEAADVMTALVDDGDRAIGFTRSRRAAELLAEFTRPERLGCTGARPDPRLPGRLPRRGPPRDRAAARGGRTAGRRGDQRARARHRHRFARRRGADRLPGDARLDVAAGGPRRAPRRRVARRADRPGRSARPVPGAAPRATCSRNRRRPR